MREITLDMLVELIKIWNFRLLLLIGLLSINCKISFAYDDGDMIDEIEPINVNNKDYALIISSYSNDSKRLSDFLKDFYKECQKNDFKLSIRLKHLNIIGFNDINSWHDNMKQILDEQDSSHLKAVILVGQEAWSLYLSINYRLPNVPFYGDHVSQNGIIIPEHVDEVQNWNPQSIDTKALAIKKGVCGAVMNNYNIEENINFIKSFYPDVKQIAFLSDNTYGGLSMQAQIKQVMKDKFPDIQLVLLDGRKKSIAEIHEMMNECEKNTVLLLGSWRINSSGSYFLDGAIPDIVSDRPMTPIFTISGVGFEWNAIGGFTPDYNINVDIIVKDITKKLKDNNKDNCFFINNNQYKVKIASLKQFGLKDYIIPQNSIIMDTTTQKLDEYKNYIIFETISLILVICLFVILRIKNYKLNKQSEELKKAKEDAIKSDTLKSAFLANISHEIRTPLNAIVGFSSLMEDANEKDRAMFSKIIGDNSNLLLELVDQIVEFSKIESGSMDLKFSEFDLKEFMEKLYEKLKENKPENLEFRLTDFAPSKSVINFDKYHLAKIITNLVSNSFKFTPHGSVDISYSIESKGFTIEISDTGIGIRKEDQNRIFQRFEKLNQFTQGTGLGLSIVKAIVEKAQGKITVESEVNEGSRFIVTIPCETQN